MEQWAALATLALFALAGLWIAFGIEGYRITSVAATDLPSNPLAKTVVREAGAGGTIMAIHPWMIMAPVLGFAGMAIAVMCSGPTGTLIAYLAAAAGDFRHRLDGGAVAVSRSFCRPRTIHAASLTVWDASSSHLTLVHHADRDADLSAHHPGLYRLGLQGDERAGDAPSRLGKNPNAY